MQNQHGGSWQRTTIILSCSTSCRSTANSWNDWAGGENNKEDEERNKHFARCYLNCLTQETHSERLKKETSLATAHDHVDFRMISFQLFYTCLSLSSRAEVYGCSKAFCFLIPHFQVLPVRCQSCSSRLRSTGDVSLHKFLMILYCETIIFYTTAEMTDQMSWKFSKCKFNIMP